MLKPSTRGLIRALRSQNLMTTEGPRSRAKLAKNFKAFHKMNKATNVPTKVSTKTILKVTAKHRKAYGLKGMI